MTRTEAADFLLELFAITPSYNACTGYENCGDHATISASNPCIHWSKPDFLKF
ncbi:hypothetical protein [Pseudomonas syringae]|uniref:hypothetical protein n=1 Tax=Pseudomonas syringae TaxID=317 RepID=UPI0012932981|nr:hypothetical protein [Pseudomonas syringae]